MPHDEMLANRSRSVSRHVGIRLDGPVTPRPQRKVRSTLTIQSLWPVPERALRDAMASARRVVVAELNLGQYRREVERVARGLDVEVVGVHRVDGEAIAPAELEEALA